MCPNPGIHLVLSSFNVKLTCLKLKPGSWGIQATVPKQWLIGGRDVQSWRQRALAAAHPLSPCSGQGRLYTCTWGTVWPSLGWSQHPAPCKAFFSQLPVTAFSWQSTFEKWCFPIQQATESGIRSYKPEASFSTHTQFLCPFAWNLSWSCFPFSWTRKARKYLWTVSDLEKSPFTLLTWQQAQHINVCFCCSVDPAVLFRGNQTACVSVPN